jgi:copper chaperone CopZ
MKNYKFHTNIKCSNCEAKVSKVFASEPGIASYDLDLENKKRTLTVKAIDALREEDIISLVKSAGYEAKPVKGILSFFK